jgi:hypothetical protein
MALVTPTQVTRMGGDTTVATGAMIIETPKTMKDFLMTAMTTTIHHNKARMGWMT